jgi:hypothetical protein
MLAHLNKRMDLYFQKRYKVVDYNIKTSPTREIHLPWRPYNHRKRRMAQQARKACMHITTVTQQLHHMAMATTTSNPHRVGFDTDSYDIKWTTAVANLSPIVWLTSLNHLSSLQ